MTSTVPTSCIQTESTVLKIPVTKAWTNFKVLALDKLAPDLVKSVESSASGAVGAVITTTYQDGGVWKMRVTEVSDRNFTIAYEGKRERSTAQSGASFVCFWFLNRFLSI